MFPNVMISLAGIVTDAVLLCGWPVPRLTKVDAVAAALARDIAAEAGAEISVASVAKPASAYAIATVVISFTRMLAGKPGKWPAASHLPSIAISPASTFVPATWGLPPSE